MSNLNLYLFGGPRVEYQQQKIDLPRRKALGLLAYLALSELPQTRDVLCAVFWPELDQNRARAALRSNLSALATMIPGDWLDKDSDTLAVNQSILTVDVTEFLKLIAETRKHNHQSSDMCEQCEPSLSHAADLYQADFLAGFSLPECVDFEEWQMLQREWLQRELSHVLKRLVAYHRKHREFERAFQRAHQWLNLDRLNEQPHRELMRLYMLTNQRSEALRQYQQCVELLDDKLATIPEDETTQIYQTILSSGAVNSGDQVLSVTSAVGVLPPLPLLIVGRENALRRIKATINVTGDPRPITIIQGWPGVGKSTTVAALAHDPEIARAFPDGVLWTSLGESPNILKELTTWSDALMVSERTHIRTIEELTTQLIALLKDRRALLLLDDVWKTDHITPFRVGGKACAIVLTTRLNDVAQEIASTASDIYRLPILEDEAALDLLGKLAPDTVAQYPEESRQLIRDLEALPLAIQVAGRLLHAETRLGWDVKSLLQELRSGGVILESNVPNDLVKLDHETSPTVAALLQRSTDALDEELRKRFAILGVFAPKPATFALGAMAAAWDIPDPKPYARILVNRGLLEPIHGGRFQIHALLVSHARALLEEFAH
jgi:DNA-binding SARP family transcriptional activator